MSDKEIKERQSMAHTNKKKKLNQILKNLAPDDGKIAGFLVPREGL